MVSQSQSSLGAFRRYSISSPSGAPLGDSSSKRRRVTSCLSLVFLTLSMPPSSRLIFSIRCSGIDKPILCRVAIIARNASCTSASVIRGTAGLFLGMPSSSMSSSSPSSALSFFKYPDMSFMSTSSGPSSSKSASSSFKRIACFRRSISPALAPPRTKSTGVRYCVGLCSLRNSSNIDPNRSSSACPKIRGSSSSSSPISSLSYPCFMASNISSTSRKSAPTSF
mmetsp:Transcript_8035/g.30089  ORF Transcript_8035/g.30089 Transcript_8035/m.30089 type:complete len:224 (-) Transcript_8035:1408-2079(-)